MVVTKPALLLVALLGAACTPVTGAPPLPSPTSIAASTPIWSTNPIREPTPTRQIGPNGRLAFQRNDPSKGGVFLIQADGTGEQPVRSGTYGTPKWSPDG